MMVKPNSTNICRERTTAMVKHAMDGQANRIVARALAAVLAVSAGTAARAQDTARDAGETDYLDQLRACQQITDTAQRLACYDTKVAAMISANEAGDVRIVDREDVRRTRRQLFGFKVPDLDILEGDEKDRDTTDLFETGITSARQIKPGSWRFTTKEGAVWEINNAPRRLSEINPGDTAVFKKAALGTYFIRINGQMGVKGKRIQ